LQALQLEEGQNEIGKHNLALDVNVDADVDVESATTELDKDVEAGAGAMMLPKRSKSTKKLEMQRTIPRQPNKKKTPQTNP
jgi:hypothetical protein